MAFLSYRDLVIGCVEGETPTQSFSTFTCEEHGKWIKEDFLEISHGSPKLSDFIWRKL